MYIHVKVTTDVKRDMFKRLSADHVIISVREPAEQNRANRRVLEILREHFGPRVRMISGHHSPSKIVDVDDIISV